MYLIRLLACIGIILSFSGCTTFEWTQSFPAVSDGEYREIGFVEVASELWNPLWRTPKESRIREMQLAAESMARDRFGERFGDEIQIGALEIEATWNPLSLVLGFGALGLVEDAHALARVYEAVPPPPPIPVSRPAPEPEPVPEPTPEPEPVMVTIVTFPIEPAELIKDRYGYMRTEYFPYDEAVEQITNRLAKRNAREWEVNREVEKIEPGGIIRVHIGRQELLHADTKWYQYRLETPETIVYERQGKEGIPNIRGRDGNWWNVVDLPVLTVVDDRIELTVSDTRGEVEYRYSIVRHERIEPAPPN